jgi:hypothetical protein
LLQLPSTIHVDINGTLTFYDTLTKTDYLFQYAREVTHLLSEHHTLVALTACHATLGQGLFDWNVELINKYFPWFDRVEKCAGDKALHPGVEYLIDDTFIYHMKGTHQGILFMPENDDATFIRPGIKVCNNWLEIAVETGCV